MRFATPSSVMVLNSAKPESCRSRGSLCTETAMPSRAMKASGSLVAKLFKMRPCTQHGRNSHFGKSQRRSLAER
eukprot:4047410-Pleurochrysis_carterae.AAC.1